MVEGKRARRQARGYLRKLESMQQPRGKAARWAAAVRNGKDLPLDFVSLWQCPKLHLWFLVGPYVHYDGRVMLVRSRGDGWQVGGRFGSTDVSIVQARCCVYRCTDTLVAVRLQLKREIQKACRASWAIGGLTAVQEVLDDHFHLHHHRVGLGKFSHVGGQLLTLWSKEVADDFPGSPLTTALHDSKQYMP